MSSRGLILAHLGVPVKRPTFQGRIPAFGDLCAARDEAPRSRHSERREESRPSAQRHRSFADRGSRFLTSLHSVRNDHGLRRLHKGMKIGGGLISSSFRPPYRSTGQGPSRNPGTGELDSRLRGKDRMAEALSIFIAVTIGIVTDNEKTLVPGGGPRRRRGALRDTIPPSPQRRPAPSYAKA